MAELKDGAKGEKVKGLRRRLVSDRPEESRGLPRTSSNDHIYWTVVFHHCVPTVAVA